MLPLLNILFILSFHLLLVSSSNQTHIPIVCDSPAVMSNVSTESPPSPPLKVYSRRQTSQRPPSDSPLVPHISPPQAPTVEPDFLVAIRKGIRSTCNPSLHYTALSYYRLSQPFYAYLSSISSVSIPKSVADALAHPGWRQAMLDELNALQNSGT